MSFTSDLTIDEVLLVEEAGFTPLELVMGSSYFHIGYARAPWSENQEIDALSAVMIDARHRAVQQVYEQAAAARADGVVGVRIEIEREGHHAEFTAVGTAVRRLDGQGRRWHDARGLPFTCDLSGQDFWALVRGGFRPVSLVMGVCVYHIAHQGLGAWFSQIGQNVEHVPFTQGMYDARELAMGRMQAEAQAAGGSGVVGVNVHEGHHGWDAHVLEFFMVGTAVAPRGDAQLARPRLVLSMGDR